METIRYYEELTIEEIIVDYENKTRGGAYQRLDLLYSKGGYELLREFAEWLDTELSYANEFEKTELNDLIWFDERINEKIDELLEDEEEDEEDGE